jgi:general secretion pathway protein F
MRYRLMVFREREGVRLMHVEAQSESAAVHRVTAEGAAVLSVRAERAWLAGGFRRRGAFPLLQLSQEMLALLRAGIGLVEAIETLAEKEQSPDTRATLEGILQDLRAGKSFSAALEGSSQTFPALYVATVRASERTGDLVDALGRYVAYQLQLETARKTVLAALVYPSLLLGVGLVVTMFLLVYVVPRFSKIFEDRASDIPLLTRMLMGWGNLINNHALLFTAGAALAVLAIGVAAARPEVRALAFRALLAVPRIGERVRLYQLARVYRTLGMLLRSGMPAVTALAMVRGLLDESMRPMFDRASTRIREGTPISAAMQEAGLTTPVAMRMLRVGEQTGNMGAMMERLAELGDDENARALDLFSRTFEPVLMALIGLVIGSIVVLMYLPIFELAANIQ